MANVGDLVTKFALFGAGGWVLENALCRQDRYSTLFRGAKIPFMPIYAVNGVALTAVAPFFSKWPILARGLAYAVLGSGIEWAGCQIDRRILSSPSWNFGSTDSLARLSEGCVDFTRSAMWGGMGLIAEKV